MPSSPRYLAYLLLTVTVLTTLRCSQQGMEDVPLEPVIGRDFGQCNGRQCTPFGFAGRRRRP